LSDRRNLSIKHITSVYAISKEQTCKKEINLKVSAAINYYIWLLY